MAKLAECWDRGLIPPELIDSSSDSQDDLVEAEAPNALYLECFRSKLQARAKIEPLLVGSYSTQHEEPGCLKFFPDAVHECLKSSFPSPKDFEILFWFPSTISYMVSTFSCPTKARPVCKRVAIRSLTHYGLTASILINPTAFSDFLKAIWKSDWMQIALSDVYSHLRALEKGREHQNESWVPPDRFVRDTTKFWLKPEDVIRFKVQLIPHLPLFMFNRKESQTGKPVLTVLNSSLYPLSHHWQLRTAAICHTPNYTSRIYL